MKRRSKILNIGYGNIFASYWMFYGVANAFASAFLLAKGYSNAEIGIILAVGSVMAVFLQPIMADLADRSKKISLIGVTQLATILLMVLEFSLFVMSRKSAALWTVFMLIIAWLTALQPLFNSMAFRLEESGVKIRFGICRGMGSLGFALLTAVLGTFVEIWGASILPFVGELTLLSLLLTLIIVKAEFNKGVRERKNIHIGASESQTSTENENCGQLSNAADLSSTHINGGKEQEINLGRFLRDNKLFLVMNFGVIGLYFSNAILNNFMLQVVNAVGGTSEDMGRVLAVMAFMEMPALFFFDQVKARFSCQTLLKVAAIGFTMRVGLIYLAKSMTLIYLAHIFQTLGFALFLPSMVVFIGDVMREGEAVKGQAFFTTMTTVGAMISSVLGGVMLDFRDAGFMLLVSTVITGLGALVIICVVDKIKKR